MIQQASIEPELEPDEEEEPPPVKVRSQQCLENTSTLFATKFRGHYKLTSTASQIGGKNQKECHAISINYNIFFLSILFVSLYFFLFVFYVSYHKCLNSKTCNLFLIPYTW